MNAPLLHVTDHAVLRWLERVEGTDMNAVREKIRLAVAVGERAPDGAIHVGNGSIIMEDDRIVTILARGQRPSPNEKMQRRRKRRFREKNRREQNGV